VEVWLLAVEDAIKQSLHSLARESLTAYAKTARSTWILQWPGQLVLNCSQASPAASRDMFQLSLLR
jgi:dynein heavy chain